MTRWSSLILSSIILLLAAQSSAQIQKLPATVNHLSEGQIMPVVGGDGRSLYFARPRTALDSSIVFDVWRSPIKDDSVFENAEVVSGNLRSMFGIAVASVAPDNNTIYLVGKMREDTPPSERIYVSHRTEQGWSIPESIHIENLNARGVATDYSFGPDQKSLIMSIERDSSLGGRDLYISFLNEKTNAWSTPMWLGDMVNSQYDEVTPFLAADGKTLYFSSSKPGGIGQMDVYRSNRLDNSWRKWTVPENLGRSINRSGRTLYYTQDVANKWAYFVYRRDPADVPSIYRAPVPQQRAVPIAMVQGKVLDNEGKPLLARIRYQRLSDGSELGTARSNPTTGEYQLSLAAGDEYAAHAELEGYIPVSEHWDLRKLNFSQTINTDLVLTRLNKGVTVRLNNIFFDVDKATLLQSSNAELDRLAQLLEKSPKLTIAIEGHTDAQGNAQHNKQLSKDRAESVRAYLIAHGIAGSRLTSEAYGAEKPLATNDTEEGRAQNRRVQFRVVGNE